MHKPCSYYISSHYQYTQVDHNGRWRTTYPYSHMHLIINQSYRQLTEYGDLLKMHKSKKCHCLINGRVISGKLLKLLPKK